MLAWPNHSVSGERKAATLHSNGMNKNRGAEGQRVMKTPLKNRRTYTENLSSKGKGRGGLTLLHTGFQWGRSAGRVSIDGPRILACEAIPAVDGSRGPGAGMKWMVAPLALEVGVL